MAANLLRLNGVSELLADLKGLSPALVGEGAAIVEGHARAAAARIAAAYPVRTGELRRGLTVEVFRDAASVTAKVRNKTFYATAFEEGTPARTWRRGGRAGKSSGVMPAGHVFVPIVVQQRRLMRSQLIALVERAGLSVTGTAA